MPSKLSAQNEQLLQPSPQLTTRPSFRRTRSPARSSIARCFMKPGSEIAASCASSLTAVSPAASPAMTARRVGSASAPNSASRRAG